MQMTPSPRLVSRDTPTAHEAREALLEFFAARAALEGSEAHARYLRAVERIEELSLGVPSVDACAIGQLVAAFGPELFISQPQPAPAL